MTTTFKTVVGFCNWDIVAAIILAIVVVIFAVRYYKLRKQEKELAETLDKLNNPENAAGEGVVNG